MRAVIVVYSRSGNTLKAAKALAGTLGAEISQISCYRNYGGPFGFMRGVIDSLMRHTTPIDVPEVAGGPHDLIVLAAPLWAGRPAAPLMAYLARRPKLPGRVALLLTHGGSDPSKAFAEVEALVGAPLAARLAVKEVDVKHDRFAAPLGDFARHAVAAVEEHLIARSKPRAA